MASMSLLVIVGGFVLGLVLLAFIVSRLAAASPPSFESDAPVAVPALSLETITAVARRGEKIQAIKLYRELTGKGLAEAKTDVEALMEGKTPGVAPAPTAPLATAVLSLETIRA